MAFSAEDIVSDSPTNNHCVWNNLAGRYKNSTSPFLQPTFSEGNTKVTAHSSEVTHAIGTIASSQKHYAEFIVNGGTSVITGVGVVSSEWDKSNLQSYIYNFEGAIYAAEGTLYSHTTTDTSPIAITTSFRVGIEVDFGANEVAFFKVESNGTRTQQGSTITTNIDFKGSGSFAASLHNSGDYIEAYFIEDDWWGTPNSGYTALCTANLPDFTPDVDDDTSQDYFKAVTYTGNGGTDKIINCGFSPDILWFKQRTDTGTPHRLMDTVRGVDNYLATQDTVEELSYDYLDINNSTNDITLKANSGVAVNASSKNHVVWCWKAGGAPSGSTSTTGSAKRINTSGTQDDTSCSALATAATNAGASNVITPTLMSINQAAGFSIVKFNAGSAGNKTIPHGLEYKPDFVLLKKLDGGAGGWFVYHNGLSDDTKYLYLHDAFSESDLTQNSRTWGGRTFDNNVISAESAYTMQANQNYIAYCWHSVEGFSKFGSYTGNGSPDGPFVYTGFRPAFVMWKRTDVSNNWIIVDAARDIDNPAGASLVPNSPGAESSYSRFDLLSNGFKFRQGGTGWLDQNADGGTYIFMAFSEQPFKYSNAR